MLKCILGFMVAIIYDLNYAIHYVEIISIYMRNNLYLYVEIIPILIGIYQELFFLSLAFHSNSNLKNNFLISFSLSDEALLLAIKQSKAIIKRYTVLHILIGRF